MEDLAAMVRGMVRAMPPGPMVYHLSPAAKRWWQKQAETAATVSERAAAAHVLRNCRVYADILYR